jgi:hypothetical protein
MSESTPVGMADRIVLTLPAAPRLRGVATLVLGGVGSRLDLPYEKVDDLQLAVLSVMAASDLDTITIEVEIDDEQVDVSVGPLPEGGASDRGLRSVVEQLMDRVELSERDGRTGDAEEWITLRLRRGDS